MLREKKVFAFYGRSLGLYNPTDLSKKWFLFWKLDGKRVRNYGNINSGITFEERMELAERHAEKMCMELAGTKSATRKLIDDYIEEKAYEWRKSTVVNVRSICKKLFEWLDGKELTNVTMQEFFSYLKKNRHPSTYNNYRMWLKKIAEDCKLYGLMAGINAVKTVKTPQRYFQPHQIKKLKDYILEHDPELWLYCQFVYYCFIRPSRELPKLQAGEIMMDERKILIPAVKAKNNKNQYITIPDAFFDCLTFIYDLSPADYLFSNKVDKSKPVGRNTMNARHAKILKHLNFGAGYSLYSWKHTGAVMAAKSGVSIVELQMQLRHYSLDQVQQYLRQMGVQDMGSLRNKFPAI